MSRWTALALVIGCGGAGLKYTVDDSILRGASLEERQAVLLAQDEMLQARAEASEATQELAGAEALRASARKEVEKARASEQAAQAAQRAAEQASDIEAQNRCNRQCELSAAAVRTAQAKSELVEARLRAAPARKAAATARGQAAQARYELEKARLAQKKNLKPSDDFDVARFDSQWMKAQAVADARKGEQDARAVEIRAAQEKLDAALARERELKGGGG
jgi:hypothetical protein